MSQRFIILAHQHTRSRFLPFLPLSFVRIVTTSCAMRCPCRRRRGEEEKRRGGETARKEEREKERQKAVDVEEEEKRIKEQREREIEREREGERERKRESQGKSTNARRLLCGSKESTLRTKKKRERHR